MGQDHDEVHGPRTVMIGQRNPVTQAFEFSQARTLHFRTGDHEAGDHVLGSPSFFKGLIRNAAQEHMLPSGGGSWLMVSYVRQDALLGGSGLGPPAMTGGMGEYEKPAYLSRNGGGAVVNSASATDVETNPAGGEAAFVMRRALTMSMSVVSIYQGLLDPDQALNKVDKINLTTTFGLPVNTVRYGGFGSFQAWKISGMPLFYMRHTYHYTRGPASREGFDGWYHWVLDPKQGKANIALEFEAENINLTNVLGLTN